LRCDWQLIKMNSMRADLLGATTCQTDPPKLTNFGKP